MDRRHIRQSAIKYKLPSLEEDPIEGIECRWLPFAKSTKEVKYAAFHGEEPSLKLMPKYREFNNLCYLTGLKTAKRLLEDDAVNTEDVVLRPLRAICKCAKEQQQVKAVRFMPNTDDQLKATGMVRTRREPKGLVKFVIAIQGDEGSCSVFQSVLSSQLSCAFLSYFLSFFISFPIAFCRFIFIVFSCPVCPILFYSIFLFYIMLCSPLFFPSIHFTSTVSSSIDFTSTVVFYSLDFHCIVSLIDLTSTVLSSIDLTSTVLSLIDLSNFVFYYLFSSFSPSYQSSLLFSRRPDYLQV